MLSITGRFTLSQKINPRVWGLIYSVIQSRMKEGEFTVWMQPMQEMRISQSTENLSRYSDIKPSEFHEKLQYRTADFSQYKRIHYIGDINGNHPALMKYLEHGLNGSDLCIFTGDYIDKIYTGNIGHCSGTIPVVENAEVIKFLISIMGRDNVILLEGDHEKRLCEFQQEHMRGYLSGSRPQKP